MGRDEIAAAVQRELTVFARRVRGVPQHQELPFVAYSMLSSIDAADGCRSVDLAALYRLDKSTVSRQVGDLEHRGLVTKKADPERGRGQVLTVTPAGRALLQEAAATRQAELARRVATWSDEELAAFAAALQRYNAAEPD
jgi:DNA-binding MarR family transcriptional regulator